MRKAANASADRKTRRSKGRGARRSSRWWWVELPDEQLLDLRLSDLRLKIAGTYLERRVHRILAELAKHDIRLKPTFWLSSEWFTPDGVAGVALPFYLAHPRLMKLEESQMFEAEGGTPEWCMRLLRHEVGHAVCNAYRLHRKRRWQSVFGKFSEPYPEYYQPRPYSKRFVLHLDYWYAQSHPSEDFAETFAVWLTPGSQWQKRYRGWPALKKLELVDELMGNVAGQRPPPVNRERHYSLDHINITLRKHYEEKRARYGTDRPDFYDKDLRRLFSEDAAFRDREPAARFLRRVRPELRRLVARWTGQYQYTIDQVLKDMIARCMELKLRLCKSAPETKLEAATLLTFQTMNYLHSGYHRIAV